MIAAIGKSVGCTAKWVCHSSFIDLYYNTKLNAGVAIFQIFASQMLGYGMAGMREYHLFSHPKDTAKSIAALVRTLLVYPT